jgi:hypothetical protein
MSTGKNPHKYSGIMNMKDVARESVACQENQNSMKDMEDARKTEKSGRTFGN